MKYPALRTVHLLCGAFALPLLAMYAISAIQMAHPEWFAMRPRVSETDLALRPGYTDGRRIAREAMVRGDVESARETVVGFNVRVVVPGTVHEIRYDRATGAAHVRTSVAGLMGMLNRLHHAAGLWHAYVPLRLWGLLVGLVSLATLGLGATGIWMWWLRRGDRKWGLVLIAANLAFSLTVLGMLRAAGP